MSDFDDNDSPRYAADLHRQGEIETAARKPSRSRKWLGRMVGLSFVGLLVGLGIIGILKFANDPVTGTVESASTLKKSTDPTPMPPGTLNGLYMSLNYPGVFNQVSQIKNDPNGLEQYNLDSSTSYRRTVTVEVRTLPSGRPDDDSSYRLREIQIANYTPSTKIVNGETVSIMTKTDGSEISWYWPHKGNVLGGGGNNYRNWRTPGRFFDRDYE